ncbi:protoglobin domain-containing protein [Natrarchaeobaculum sulfurireducens]|uniref:Methyl-accepting chemotaxis protein n=1 Tax=Natrarchaeobaculum sulfurireducens TaxID=2044521 RepID=A0A346P9N1_9EURY|nr:protoglobin domain-containing protein [Natrarchaeobaculum sulfurireducens]AXR76226.1 methyl-accepting chemotaxis protein [Natrarchaeobaculum sulfurireducens]
MDTEGWSGSTSLDKTANQLAEEIGLTEEEIAWRKAFVGFDTEEQERMARLGDVVSEEKEQLTDAFLETIYAHDRTRAVVDRSSQGDDGLRRVVETYLETLTGGTYDTEYYTQRCRIGRIHDQLDLPLHHFSGMFGNVTTLFLEEIKANTIETARNAAESDGPDAVEAAIEEGFADAMATTRCINLEMQVVNDTYESRRRELREAINLIPDPIFELTSSRA